MPAILELVFRAENMKSCVTKLLKERPRTLMMLLLALSLLMDTKDSVIGAGFAEDELEIDIFPL